MSARARARALNRALNRTNAANDLTLARALSHDLARALSHDLAHARYLADALAGEVARVRTTLHHVSEFDIGLAFKRDRTLDRALALANDLAAEMKRSGQATSAKAKSSQKRPARAAERLAAIAAQVLPAGERIRYGEEFAGDLLVLAEDGMPRWRQLLYALRLLDRAWVLRAELAQPARHGAAP